MNVFLYIFSEESYIWWVENVNNNVTQISVTENSLGLSPDCVSERVEIYSGKDAGYFRNHDVP